MYHSSMRLRSVRAAAGVLACAASVACAGALGRQYEYEEELYLSVDGSAQAVVNASIPALIALRGLPLDPSPAVPPNRDQIRQLLASAGCDVTSVGQPWTRRGRRFVQIRVAHDDVSRLSECRLLSWSRYRLERTSGDQLRYTQAVGAPTAGNPGAVNWDGTEVVGFRLHLPSRILFQNVKRLETGENGTTERGNILSYEQRLSDRRNGVSMDIRVDMGAESILFQTLTLFAVAGVAAVLVLAGLVWLTVRRARRRGLPLGSKA